MNITEMIERKILEKAITKFILALRGEAEKLFNAMADLTYTKEDVWGIHEKLRKKSELISNCPRPGNKWHDGESVTVEDAEEYLRNHGLWEDIEGFINEVLSA